MKGAVVTLFNLGFLWASSCFQSVSEIFCEFLHNCLPSSRHTFTRSKYHHDAHIQNNATPTDPRAPDGVSFNVPNVRFWGVQRMQGQHGSIQGILQNFDDNRTLTYENSRPQPASPWQPALTRHYYTTSACVTTTQTLCTSPPSKQSVVQNSHQSTYQPMLSPMHGQLNAHSGRSSSEGYSNYCMSRWRAWPKTSTKASSLANSDASH